MERDGILLVNKEEGFTSFDVVAKLRGILRMRKIGHAGTLDPMATGVLPVFLGNATRAIPYLENHDKAYTATFCLGQTTDTLDKTGKVLTRHPVTATAADVKKVLVSFLGEVWQTPPMYSAVKIGGKKLYQLARQGIEIERPKRQVFFHEIHLLAADQITNTYTIAVTCSKGTYIRTLCDDIGQKMGCGAVLLDLERTMACGYPLVLCQRLGQIEQVEKEEGGVLPLPVATAFAHLTRIDLTEKTGGRFLLGQKLALEQLPPLADEGQGPFAVFGPVDGEPNFLGLAEKRTEEGVLKPLRIFYKRSE